MLKTNRFVKTVATISVALVLTLGGASAAQAKTNTAEARCQLIQISPNTIVGHVEGYGEGNTVDKARAAALKDADRRVPAGHYKRHCVVSINGRMGGGGGRF